MTRPSVRRRRGVRAGRGLAALLLGLAAIAAPAQVAAPLPADAPLTLAETARRVLARDPALRIARERVGIADAQAAEARSAFWPRAGLAASTGRSTDRDAAATVDRTTQRLDALLRWNLYNGGSDRRESEAAALERQAAVAEWLAAIEEAAGRAVEAQAEALRGAEQVALAADHHAEIEALVQRVARQAEAGKAAPADLDLAQATLAEARVAEGAARSALAAASDRLAVLAGVAAGTPAPGGVWPGDGTPAADTPDAQPARYFPWQAAQASAEAARRRIAAIPPEWQPRVDLELRKRLGGEVTPPSSSIVSERGWTVSIALDVPLGGAPAARRAAARHRAAAAEAEVQRTADQLQTDWSKARHAARDARSAAALLDREVRLYAAAVQASDLQWQAGRRSVQQVIDLRAAWRASERRRIDNRYAGIAAQTRLLALSGTLAETLGIEPSTPEPVHPDRPATPDGDASLARAPRSAGSTPMPADTDPPALRLDADPGG